MSDYKTCTHLYDDGNRCGSAALTNRDYCSYSPPLPRTPHAQGPVPRPP